MIWLLKMAWRDTRSSRRRLLLYTASITLGIAALVSIESVGKNMRYAVRQQSAEILGADLVVRANDPFDEEAEAFIAGIAGRQAREAGFSSMILHPNSGSSRLVSVRAIDEGFPFYGKFKTVPAGAGETFRSGRNVLVEENVMLQFGAEVGDGLKLGTQTFTIAGALQSVPGESLGFNLVAPRVYMPRQFLKETDLVQKGSRVRYKVYFAVDEGVDVDAMRDEHGKELRNRGISLQTVKSRQSGVAHSIARLERFLGLVGFVALLLGGVGVASGIHVFVRQKLSSIAVLRCVGATTWQTVGIYLIQAAGIGAIGATAGCVIGIGIQAVIPYFIGDVIPADFEFKISKRTVVEGLLAGMTITVALALLPLLGVRRVSPLLALRSEIEPPKHAWWDPMRLAVIGIGLAAVTYFAVEQAQRIRHGVGMVGGTVVVFVALVVLGHLMMHAARRMVSIKAPYFWRQGIANLFRPNNRTHLVVLALGLGTFLIVTMHLTQRTLVRELALSEAGTRSNVVLFDIQEEQREGVRDTITELGLPVFDEAPIVTMRLASVKGRSVDEILDDPDRKIQRWVLNREYRSTYRGEINDAEHIASGEFMPYHDLDDGPVPVSVAADIARDLEVEVGDELVFDVQGVPVNCVVGSTREIDTKRVAPFFFVLFPNGVLEDAPKFVIMTTRVAGSAESGQLQRNLFLRYPNVSVVDLMLILKTLNEVLERVGFVFRFMAIFIIGTGLVVMAGVMASGRFQRLKESVLLRTLGSSRHQIVRIQLVEYWLLGTLAGLAGVILAWFAAWGLAWWVFDINALPEIGPLFIAWIVVSALTVVTGMLSGRRLLNHPPLELLRQEV